MAPISIRIGVPQVVKKQSEKSIHTHTTWPYWCQFHKPLAISRMKSNMINWHNFRKENAKKKLHANFSYLYINIFNYKTWQRWGHLQLNITKSTTLDINASIHSATKLYPSFIHSSECAECNDSLPFSGASSSYILSIPIAVHDRESLQKPSFYSDGTFQLMPR